MPLTGDPRRPAGGDGRPGLLRRRARPRTPTAPATSCCSTPATEIVRSENGLLTTVCYQFGDATRRSTRSRARSPSPARPCSGCATSSASSAAPRESEALARQVEDNGGVYFVPAFSGLFAPYWRSDARGAIVGLSRFNTNAHLARATLEAICYQSRDVVDAMEADSGVHLEVLKVDGGVTANDLCMQIQADVLGVDGEPAGGRRDDRARRGLRRRPGRRLLGRHRRAARELARGPALDAAAGPTSSARPATPAGRRRSSAPWTGSTSTDRRDRPTAATGATPHPLAADAAARQRRPRRWPRMAERSSTCWSSAAGWSAPAARWTR